ARSGSARGVPAGDDAVRRARHPGAAGGLPHDDHEDLEPLPVSAQARAGRRRLVAAPGRHGRAAAGAVRGPGPPRIRSRRRKERTGAPGEARAVALARARTLPRDPLAPDLPAIRGAGERRVLQDSLTAADPGEVHARPRPVRLPRALRDPARAEEYARARA